MRKIFLICVFIIVPLNINAYVLPGKQVIELMIKSIGAPEGLSAHHKFIMIDQNLGSDPLEFMETIYYKFPGYLYSEIMMNEKHKLHVVSPKGIITVIEGIITQEPQTTFDHYKDILLYRSKKEITRRLSSMGVNIGVSSYGKHNKNAYYVVGAKYPDESVPQFWVDINDLKPYRWIISPKTENMESIEIRYTQWIPVSDDSWYPNLVEYYQNDLLLAKIMLDSYDLNPEVSGDLFDVSNIRKAYEEGSSSISSEESDLNEVQKTIRNFRNTFQ